MMGRTSVGGLMMLCAALCYGQENPDPHGLTPPPSSAAQAIYKGVVGNILDAMPLDSDNRVQLQRLNAVVSSPLGGRSLALALGITSPPLTVIGVIWGLWSASKIQAEKRADRLALEEVQRAAPRPPLEGQEVTRGDGILALEHKYVASNALASMVGGAAASSPGVPCDGCVMPMLYSRTLPPAR
jgi:hypothetical protein